MVRSFEDFLGNPQIVEALRSKAAQERLPQTLLFAGPWGAGKATLARLLAAALNCEKGAGEVCGRCGNCTRILEADLSKPEYRKIVEERRKLPSAKRNEDPLIFSTHPDFLIFPPDGPLEMITIEQARELRNAARFGPSQGRRRLFLIDHADRANDEAANSLLKTLEEPASSLTLVLTAESPYEMLPTIRSRSVPFHFAPLSREEMERFFDSRPELSATGNKHVAGWAQGSPGRALELDADEYRSRREAVLALIRTSLGQGKFIDLLPHTESLARRRDESLRRITEMFYAVLQDLLHLRHGVREGLIHADILDELDELASRTGPEWFDRAVAALDELEELRRRNIQRQIALEAMALNLRSHAPAERAGAEAGRP